MPPRHHRGRRAATCALLVLLCVSLAACGGDDRAATPDAKAATTTTVALARWQTSVDAACTALNTRYADLADAQPADADAAVGYSADVDRFVRAIADAVDEGGVPAERRGAAEALGARLDELATATRQLASAAADGDPARATTAAAKVDELAAQVNPAATELGVPACGGF